MGTGCTGRIRRQAVVVGRSDKLQLDKAFQNSDNPATEI
jgi:hypothetical protein